MVRCVTNQSGLVWIIVSVRILESQQLNLVSTELQVAELSPLLSYNVLLRAMFKICDPHMKCNYVASTTVNGFQQVVLSLHPVTLMGV